MSEFTVIIGTQGYSTGHVIPPVGESCIHIGGDCVIIIRGWRQGNYIGCTKPPVGPPLHTYRRDCVIIYHKGPENVTSGCVPPRKV